MWLRQELPDKTISKPLKSYTYPETPVVPCLELPIYISVYRNTHVTIFNHLDMIESIKPKRQIMDSSKLKEFADGKLRFDENGGKFFKWVENTMGKGAISPFPTVFSKDLQYRHVITWACLGKG